MHRVLFPDVFCGNSALMLAEVDHAFPILSPTPLQRICVVELTGASSSLTQYFFERIARAAFATKAKDLGLSLVRVSSLLFVMVVLTELTLPGA